MGYMRHHAIIVTSWKIKPGKSTDAPGLEKVRKEAQRIFGKQVSPIIASPVNGYGSILIAPDGSKEGWLESEEGNQRRAEFIAWLETLRYEDGSTSLDWVEVQYGDDDGATHVVSDSDSKKRVE